MRKSHPYDYSTRQQSWRRGRRSCGWALPRARATRPTRPRHLSATPSPPTLLYSFWLNTSHIQYTDHKLNRAWTNPTWALIYILDRSADNTYWSVCFYCKLKAKFFIIWRYKQKIHFKLFVYLSGCLFRLIFGTFRLIFTKFSLADSWCYKQ